MIITDILQIDSIAENILGTSKGIVCLDMKDYNSFKERSTSLRATKIEIPCITEENLETLQKALEKLSIGEYSNIMLYVCGNEIKSGAKAVTIEHMQLFNNALCKYITESTDIIWGLGECENEYDGVTIFVVVGCCNQQ